MNRRDDYVGSSALEILHAPPKRRRSGRPPLLFLHGAYAGAWCWQEKYLPYFAAAGFDCYALSFSGHGGSAGREQLDNFSIDDYVADVLRTVNGLSAVPVLMAHSMGGFVAQKYLEQYPAAAAILMCTVPPQGLSLSAIHMFFKRPGLMLELNRLISNGRIALDSLSDALFYQPHADAELKYLQRMSQPESKRALWDMLLYKLPQAARVLEQLPRGREDLWLVGVEHDLIIAPELVRMAASSYGLEAEIFSGLGHALMLENDWQPPADAMIAWLEKRFG